MKPLKEVEVCECETCIDSDEPCQFDCDFDNLCVGCQYALACEADDDYSKAVALGYWDCHE